jgi:hypothetical protein
MNAWIWLLLTAVSLPPAVQSADHEGAARARAGQVAWTWPRVPCRSLTMNTE